MNDVTVDFDHDKPYEKTFSWLGNKATIRREDPYGFWYIHLDKGNLPNDLKNAAYTSAYAAEKAVKHWLDQRNKKITKEED